jgi:hypothetical protein
MAIKGVGGTKSTPARTARRVNLTPARVRHLVREGRLTPEFTALHRLVHADSVEALLAERMAAAGSRDATSG